MIGILSALQNLMAAHLKWLLTIWVISYLFQHVVMAHMGLISKFGLKMNGKGHLSQKLDSL